MSRVFELYAAMFNRKQEEDSINAHYSVLKGYWEELLQYHPNTTDLTKQKRYREEFQVALLLSSLNSDYSVYKDQIMASKKLPTAAQAYSRLQRGFQGRGGRNSNDSPMKCIYCGKLGHVENFCYLNHEVKLSKPPTPPLTISSTSTLVIDSPENPRKEVNAVLKEEAAYFGDIVILPFMDRYELVVLKTIAICDFGVHNLTAAYIMKCDDDTFVRVDTVLKEINGISHKRPLYMGNLNLLHRPLRNGKWAVTYEEWPEEVYPPYANGPGYLFKMEDVSMGMWVENFNSSTTSVQYSHSWKFCQYGCMEDYYSAHYQFGS
ncbi:hypothetical protein GIB67_031659 [Kingdonia uniflora]|uniref:Hexosyltransferase n=1 Tax=Kingdonia uniflora TaxID=39325 RepID=A0A7J7NKM2_9MAGN|nr:hypothetical protein GIB67_031659 [Kingdonia uniflora]